MAAGEVASRLAISTSLKLIQRSEKWGFKINQREARELFERITQYLQEIDKTLTEQSEADHRLWGMGTTLTAAYSIGVDLFIIHLGDSRAYLYRDGTLQQLTKDHTVAQAMADAGYIAPEEVRHHAKRNALTNFLGGHHGKVKADLRWLRLADGDRLLLCSDGLNEMVDDDAIARILGAARRPRAKPPSPCSMRPSTAAARTTSPSSWPATRSPAVGPRAASRPAAAAVPRSRRRPTRSPGRPAPPNEPAGRPPPKSAEPFERAFAGPRKRGRRLWMERSIGASRITNDAWRMHGGTDISGSPYGCGACEVSARSDKMRAFGQPDEDLHPERMNVNVWLPSSPRAIGDRPRGRGRPAPANPRDSTAESVAGGVNLASSQF